MATYSSILAWKTPWTQESGGLQSMGSHRIGHDWATSLTLSNIVQGAIYISALPTATLANLIYLGIHHVFNRAFFFFLPKNTIQLYLIHCFYISRFYLFFEIQMKIELKVSFMRKPSMGSILIQMPLLLELFNSLVIYHLAFVGFPHSTFLFQSVFQGRDTVLTTLHPRFSTMSGTCQSLKGCLMNILFDEKLKH